MSTSDLCERIKGATFLNTTEGLSGAEAQAVDLLEESVSEITALRARVAELVELARRITVGGYVPLSEFDAAEARVAALEAENARLRPYVEAFRREETRADNAEMERDDAQARVAALK